MRSRHIATFITLDPSVFGYFAATAAAATS
jgi:hypothetical protein